MNYIFIWYYKYYNTNIIWLFHKLQINESGMGQTVNQVIQIKHVNRYKNLRSQKNVTVSRNIYNITRNFENVCGLVLCVVH